MIPSSDAVPSGPRKIRDLPGVRLPFAIVRRIEIATGLRGPQSRTRRCGNGRTPPAPGGATPEAAAEAGGRRALRRLDGSADLRNLQHPGKIPRKSFPVEVRAVLQHRLASRVDDQQRRTVSPESLEPRRGNRERNQDPVHCLHPFAREIGPVGEHSDDAVVILAERDVHAPGEVKERLAVVIASGRNGVQQNPATGGTLRGGLAHGRDAHRPGRLHDLSVVHPAERTPVRPPYVESVRNQDRRSEDKEQAEQYGPVAALRPTARFRVVCRHVP